MKQAIFILCMSGAVMHHSLSYSDELSFSEIATTCGSAFLKSLGITSTFVGSSYAALLSEEMGYSGFAHILRTVTTFPFGKNGREAYEEIREIRSWLYQAHKSSYKVLGIADTASRQEIRAAYLRLARIYHPDKNPGCKKAAEHFKQINEAYQRLVKEPEIAWNTTQPKNSPVMSSEPEMANGNASQTTGANKSKSWPIRPRTIALSALSALGIGCIGYLASYTLPNYISQTLSDDTAKRVRADMHNGAACLAGALCINAIPPNKIYFDIRAICAIPKQAFVGLGIYSYGKALYHAYHDSK